MASKSAADLGFGLRLENLLIEHGLSRQEFATKVGASPTIVHQWLHGDRGPSVPMLVKMADLFDVSIDYLVGRTDDPTPPNMVRGWQDLLSQESREIYEVLGRLLHRIDLLERKDIFKTEDK